MDSLSDKLSSLDVSGPTLALVFMVAHTRVSTILLHSWTNLLRPITVMDQMISILALWTTQSWTALISPLMRTKWSIQLVFVLHVILPNSLSVLQSPVNNVFKLNRKLFKHLAHSRASLRASITHSQRWPKQKGNSLSLIISCLRVVISILSPVVWRETGLRPVVSSTTITRPSLCGLTRRISLESFPCKTVPTSARYSSVFLLLQQKLRQLLNSRMTPISAISPLAQQTSVQECAPPCTSNYPSLQSTQKSSNLSPQNTTFRFAVLMENTPNPMMVSSISLTWEDSVVTRLN